MVSLEMKTVEASLTWEVAKELFEERECPINGAVSIL